MECTEPQIELTEPQVEGIEPQVDRTHVLYRQERTEVT